jgi:periplasmic divalent cation tolerance protein
MRLRLAPAKLTRAWSRVAARSGRITTTSGSTSMPVQPYVIVLTTFPVDEDPAALARTLVGERLAACVNVLPPMPSIFRWEGGVEEVTEHQLIIKTMTDRLDRLKARLGELHPYDVPECLVLAVAGGADSYLAWLSQALQ